MKTIEKVKENGLQPLDVLAMQSVNGGCMTPVTDIDPIMNIPRDWFWKRPKLLESGASENAA